MFLFFSLLFSSCGKSKPKGVDQNDLNNWLNFSEHVPEVQLDDESYQGLDESLFLNEKLQILALSELDKDLATESDPQMLNFMNHSKTTAMKLLFDFTDNCKKNSNSIFIINRILIKKDKTSVYLFLSETISNSEIKDRECKMLFQLNKLAGTNIFETSLGNDGFDRKFKLQFVKGKNLGPDGDQYNNEIEDFFIIGPSF